MFILVPIFIGCVFIFTFAMMLSPKLRGKMMSSQIKATKHMLNESVDDLADIALLLVMLLLKLVKTF